MTGLYLRAVLAQGRVGDDKGALILADVLQRSVRRLGLLVVQDGVTLREGTTLDILSGDADVVALCHETTERESLGRRPVDALTLVNSLLAVGQDTLEVTVHVAALGGTADLVSDVPQQVRVDGGGQVRKDLSGQLLGSLEPVPGRSQPLLAGGLVVLAALEAVVQHTPDPLLVLLDVLLGERALRNQLLDILVELALLLRDALVHQRLSEGGLVGLVVALLPVADDVDDNVALERGAPVGGNLADVVDGLDVVRIDVEDRRIDGLCDIGAVRGRTSETRVGCETNLVVHDDVDGSSGRVGRKGGEAHGLIDHTLRRERSVTVQQDTHGGVELLLVLVVVLDGTGLSKHDGVFGFEVGWVGDERELDTLAGRRRTLEVHTQVVLDVAGALVGRLGGTGELAEDGLVRLADDVGEDVQTTTVGHADDDVLDSMLDAAVDQSLHTRHQGLTSLQTETLVVGELGGQESLEAGTPDQTVQDAALVVDGVAVRLGDLEAVADPVAELAVRDVDVLDTVGAAVDLLAGRDDLAQRHLLAGLGLEAGQDTGAQGELLVQILLREAIVLELQLLGLVVAEGLDLAADAQRVDLRLVVTASLVCADQKLDLQVVHDVRAGGRGQSHVLGDTAGRGGDEVGRRLEGLGDGHLALLHVLEVGLPRDVHAGGVFPPREVHLVNVVGRVALEEGVVGILCDKKRARRNKSARAHRSQSKFLFFPHASSPPSEIQLGVCVAYHPSIILRSHRIASAAVDDGQRPPARQRQIRPGARRGFPGAGREVQRPPAGGAGAAAQQAVARGFQGRGSEHCGIFFFSFKRGKGSKQKRGSMEARRHVTSRTRREERRSFWS